MLQYLLPLRTALSPLTRPFPRWTIWRRKWTKSLIPLLRLLSARSIRLVSKWRLVSTHPFFLFLRCLPFQPTVPTIFPRSSALISTLLWLTIQPRHYTGFPVLQSIWCFFCFSLFGLLWQYGNGVSGSSWRTQSTALSKSCIGRERVMRGEWWLLLSTQCWKDIPGLSWGR